MRHLLNTLYITSEDLYLSLDGENVVVNREKQEVARYPLHALSGILSFSYAGASPALMGACAARAVPCPCVGRELGERAPAADAVPNGGRPGSGLYDRAQHDLRQSV